MKLTHLFCLIVIGALAGWACVEKGETGETGIDCGPHGSAHEGHCHCNEGYLFNGETCVAPDEITQVCDAAEAPDGGAVTEETHHHEACRCPAEGDCPCDGEIQTIGGVDFCAPELHDE